MPTWNHRVVQKRDPNYCEGSAWPENYYEIHEAHYNNNGDLCAITEDAIMPYGETIEELKETLEWMLNACDQPILVDGEIDYASWDDEDGESKI
jgi:hypothetical protein